MSSPAKRPTSPGVARSPPAPAAAGGSPHTLAVGAAASSPARNTRSRSPSPQPQPIGGPQKAVRSVSDQLAEQLQALQLEAATAGPSEAEKKKAAAEKLHQLQAEAAATAAAIKPVVAATSSVTGLVYDARCLLHQANYAHVEKPQRASESMKLLISSGVYERCVHVSTRRVTDAELHTAHPDAHVKAIDATEAYDYKPDELDSETEGDETLYPDCKFFDNDTYVNRYSSAAARYSIGGLINLMEAVLAGTVKNGFAVIRPPGHHADTVKSSGFCLYNNVAVAVEAVRNSHPEKVKKVVIVDWDVHHGNGTQSMTYNNPHILYFSIHRYQGGQFYPNTGAAEDTGGEHAPGSNINVPLNFKGLGDAEYLDTFRTLLIPCVQEFAPDLIVISAGFDCAQGDPLGGMECSSEGFAHMTRLLQDAMPHRRVVMALEGGYNVRAVSEAVVACTKTLLGDPLPELADPHSFLGKRELAKVAQKRELFRKDLLHCVKVQKRFWKCLSGIPTPETPEPTAAAAAPSSSASASAPPPSVAGLTVAAAALSVSNVTVAAPKSPPAK